MLGRIDLKNMQAFLTTLRFLSEELDKAREYAKEMVAYCEEQERLKAAYAEPVPPKPKGCECAKWRHLDASYNLTNGDGFDVYDERIFYCPFCGKKLEE